MFLIDDRGAVKLKVKYHKLTVYIWMLNAWKVCSLKLNMFLS